MSSTLSYHIGQNLSTVLEQPSQKICFFEEFFRYACTSAAFLRSWSRSAASG